jgi:putative tryptophan/tyrosine transport system substrate-binding protein
MKRHEFITLLSGAAAAWPLAGRAQHEGTVARVGVIGASRDAGPGTRAAYPAVVDALRKLGFTEGRNLAVEYRRVDQGVPRRRDFARRSVAQPGLAHQSGAH